LDTDRLTVISATGVDVSLAIAGPGTRSFAFIVDWHFRVLLAFAWYACAALLVAGRLLVTRAAGPPSAAFLLAAVLPATAIYFLYHPVLEVALRGRTPGKRIAGVRLVSRSGGVPSAGALLVRNVFRLIDSLPLLYVVGLASCLITADRVRIGDLAAGTVLVLDQGDALAALDQFSAQARDSAIDAATADVAGELLRRWSSLADERRAALARSLLERVAGGDGGAALDGLDSAALRGRLEALLGLGAGAA
jgi:uncharacterized RDD family membrane protein YckC